MSDYVETLAEVGSAATEGPWQWEVAKGQSAYDASLVRHISAGGDDNNVAIMDSDFESVDADARFIALSRNVWPELVAVVRAAREVEEAYPAIARPYGSTTEEWGRYHLASDNQHRALAALKSKVADL